MSDYDHASSNYSAFDNDDRSINDDWAQRDPLGQWDSPYTPGTTSGEHYRWFETQDNDLLIDPTTPYTGKLPVVQIAVTFILGVWGAIILGFLL